MQNDFKQENNMFKSFCFKSSPWQQCKEYELEQHRWIVRSDLETVLLPKEGVLSLN